MKNYKNIFDIIIIGAGPAGLQMGYFLNKNKREYLILEANNTAGQFYSKFPRHDTLLSINKPYNYFGEKDYNLRHDWNSLLCDDDRLLFKNYSKDLYPSAKELYKYLNDFYHYNNINIEFNVRVNNICKDKNGFFILKTNKKEYCCKLLFMATGALKLNLPINIKGIEHAQTYINHSLDTKKYQNKRVAIVGKGNSAFEVANYLAPHAAYIHILVREPIKHAWQTHYVGDLRAINNTILDMYQLKSLHSTLGFKPYEIKKNSDGSLRLFFTEDVYHWEKPGKIQCSLDYDFIIFCTGWKYIDLQIFDKTCKPKIDAKEKYPVLSSEWESSIKNMYYIGATMGSIDRKSASGFIHGFRYNIRTLVNIIENTFYGNELKFLEFEKQNISKISQYLITRLSTVSALYQLNGFLCDVLEICDNTIKVYSELPVKYILEKKKFLNDFLIITLDYGFDKYPNEADSLSFIHPADAFNNECSAFLHPVFKLYDSKKNCLEEFHLGESLILRYDIYDYMESKENYFFKQLSKFFSKIFNKSEYEYTNSGKEFGFSPFSKLKSSKIKKMQQMQKTQCKSLINLTTSETP